MKNSSLKLLLTVGAVLLLSSVAFAAGEGGHHEVESGVLLKDFLYRCFNFAVTFGILAYFVTKPIRKGLAGRSEGIAEALQVAEKTKADAEAKFAEYDQKLAKASAEIETIYEDIRREGELEKARILANATEMAAKITRDAEKTAANEVNKARVELRQEAARMAIAIAEELLKKNFTNDDQSRLVDEYMQKVGELH
jgi:F-type H+-transporting ATPase subunit b